MNDRELLEAAAKAHGGLVCVPGFGWIHENADGVRGAWWRPLEDDGDALRLAVKLRLKITPGKYKDDGCTVESQRGWEASCTCFTDDKSEQVRRAIVRGAAEIWNAQQ